jgi:hypothetical protein
MEKLTHQGLSHTIIEKKIKILYEQFSGTGE